MRYRQVWASVASLCLFSGVISAAQSPKPRLSAPIDNESRVSLTAAKVSAQPGGTDQGALASDTSLKGITLVFNRSAAQQTDLDTLLAAQQNQASPLFHQWLTPEQFASRFGVADADIAKTEAWLQSQGFQITGVPRSHDRITFNGTAGQVAAAFGTELHRYSAHGESHFAPDSNLSLPATLAPMVTGIVRLSNLRAHRRTRLAGPIAKPAYTSSQTGNHFLTPSDLATMYDAASLYKAGYNGAGQAIAIVGQSFIDMAPISAFQSGAGLTANLPNMVLVPGTGVNAVNSVGDGDEGESQLDVEYASGMAPGANVYFVYTGDDSNAGVFQSLDYAIAEDIAPVISGSYGLCEPELQSEGTSGQQLINVLNQDVQQASAQGQTVIFSSGDTGSTDCYGYTDQSTASQELLAVDFPASLPNVTSMGGTQMAANTFGTTNTQYWQSATGSDVISSLLSYVPETTWNEDSSANPDQPLSSGGGGSSVLFQRPTWQTGVTGIPTGTNRLVPDLALQASIESPGFIYCTSDPTDLAYSSITSSCSNGLRSPSGTFLIAGGTSFATPIFAGLLAVLNQVTHSKGQGNINPILYGLAANTTTYGTAFHDVTTGTNACTAGTSYCSTLGASQYAATTGYDEATGLGSIDLAKLIAAWPASSTSTAAATTTVVKAASSTPNAGDGDQISITVAPSSGATGTPTGSVQITVDGTAVTPTLTLSSGAATYTYTAPATTGSHVVVATYAGDGTYAASTGTAVITVGSATPSGSFSLTAPSLTVAYNGTSTANLVVTPASGYTGTVVLSLTYPSGAPTICYAVSNKLNDGSNVPLINNGLAVPVALTIGEGTACGTSATGAVVLKSGQTATRGKAPLAPGRHWPEGIAFAGLLCAGFAVRRPRRLPVLLSLTVLSVLGLGLSGCGSSSSTTTTTTPVNKTQTVTLTVTGTDSVNSTISNATTFALTIQ